MDQITEDLGVITALMERFEKQRLPRLLQMHEKVEKGETLADLDILFLKDAFETAQNTVPLVQRHPEYNHLASKVIRLYKAITEKALENEKNQVS